MKLIYLLLKQHTITKKFYLCKRVTQDFKSIFTYKGSGKRWLRHLDVHGHTFTTSIIYISNNKLDFKEKAKFFSTYWKVGSNSDFLNLRPEEGDGGNTWYNCEDKSQRSLKIYKALKQFNLTEKGRKIRATVGKITSQLQSGKTMKERLGAEYTDVRGGKKWEDIYHKGYDHPQHKPFKILYNTQVWFFKTEREFAEKLNICPDPILRILKKEKTFTFKRKKLNSKHSFNKGDVLTFEWV